MVIVQRHPFWGVSVGVLHLGTSLVLEIPCGLSSTATAVPQELVFWLTSQHLMVSLMLNVDVPLFHFIFGHGIIISYF